MVSVTCLGPEWQRALHPSHLPHLFAVSKDPPLAGGNKTCGSFFSRCEVLVYTDSYMMHTVQMENSPHTSKRKKTPNKEVQTL